MSPKTIPVIIDCDTGIDDANALVIACASARLDIRAVTTVAGNTVIENSTRNTLNVLHLLGRDDIPVGRGAAGPIFGMIAILGDIDMPRRIFYQKVQRFQPNGYLVKRLRIRNQLFQSLRGICY